MQSEQITFSEYLILSALVFDWADTYDRKKWDELEELLAPTLQVDYSELNGKRFDAMCSADFVSMVSSDAMLGSMLLRTQHIIGGSKWEKASSTEVIAYHQLQTSQTWYEDLESKKISDQSKRNVVIRHVLRNIDGRWKIASIKPSLR